MLRSRFLLGLPVKDFDDMADGQVLAKSGESFVPVDNEGGGGGTGNVVGPASATDGAVALYDGTTGKILKGGVVLGTAATTPTSDYATAAQGGKADTALQSVVPGTNVTVDNTDPHNPVVNSTGGSGGGDDFAVASGTDTITATFVTAPTLVDGLQFKVRAAGANTTTAPTFNPNSLGALTITKLGGVALAAGDISGAGHELIIRYRASPARYELVNPVGVRSVTGTAVDNTDPHNPVVNSTGGGGGGGSYMPPGYVVGPGTDAYLANVMAILPLALPNRSIAFLDLVGNPVVECAGCYGDYANTRYGYNTLKVVSSGVALFSLPGGPASGSSGVFIGTQDFCWEIDFKASGSLGSYNTLCGNRPDATATGGTVCVGIAGTNQLYVYANGAFIIAVSAATLCSTPNAWHKVAYTVTSGTGRLFLDGVLIGTGTQPTVSYTTKLTLGSDYNGQELFAGNLANFRYTLGQSRYTATYTPLTTPFPFA